jgi:hypothetical protein
MDAFPLLAGLRQLPDDVIYVGHRAHRQPGSPWGNRFSVRRYGRDKAIALYRAWLAKKLAVNPAFLEPLRGKRLACWCAPDACHADVLAEFVP